MCFMCGSASSSAFSESLAPEHPNNNRSSNSEDLSPLHSNVCVLYLFRLEAPESETDSDNTFCLISGDPPQESSTEPHLCVILLMCGVGVIVLRPFVRNKHV